MRPEPNAYSRQWFEFFHMGIGEARTIQETAFVCRCAPLPDFRKLADVCCGMGRHARALSNQGYSVIGIERDVDAVATARELNGGPSYVHADIRDYRPEPEAFDVAIVMSQSFGYFDPITNRDVLGRLVAGLREGGRVILDLWNQEFFAAHQDERELETASGVVRESKRLNGDRLCVQLDYPDGAHEEFEWQLFPPTPRLRLLPLSRASNSFSSARGKNEGRMMNYPPSVAAATVDARQVVEELRPTRPPLHRAAAVNDHSYSFPLS